MVGNAGTAASLHPSSRSLGIACRCLDLDRESVDPPGLMRQKPVEVSTPSLEIAFEQGGAAQ